MRFRSFESPVVRLSAVSFVAASISMLGLACSRSNPNATPKGTTVVDWKLAQSDRETIRAAKISDVVRKDLAYVAHPTADTSVELALHLETATVAYQEDGKEVVHTAPIRVTAEMVGNGDFTVGNGKCMGPHYQLTAPGQAPRDMILHCSWRAAKPRYDVGFTIYAYGDGRVDDGLQKVIKVL